LLLIESLNVSIYYKIQTILLSRIRAATRHATWLTVHRRGRTTLWTLLGIVFFPVQFQTSNRHPSVRFASSTCDDRDWNGTLSFQNDFARTKGALNDEQHCGNYFFRKLSIYLIRNVKVFVVATTKSTFVERSPRMRYLEGGSRGMRTWQNVRNIP